MSLNESDFKKLGFFQKKGEKHVLEASAEITRGEYITIQLDILNGKVAFSGVQIQGLIADEKRKEYLKKYSLEEIYKLFSDY